MPIEKINFEQFKYSLLLVADDYVKEEEKEILKKIIANLKTNLRNG